MKLENYKSLGEKEDIFKFVDYLKIDTVSEFNEWYDKYLSKNKVFRGVNEAKYKIYTSAQREYIKRDLNKSGKSVDDIIAEELKQVKLIDDGLLKKYFDLLGICDVDLLYLSFLQHYSGFSPLIDFTANLNKALFFMQDSCVFPKIGGEDIDNYMSLYSREIEESHSHPNIDEPTLRERTSFSYIRRFKDATIEIFSPKYKIGESMAMTMANLNLVAQEGRFICYINDIKPLEENISCVDIHKSLTPYLKKILKDQGIDKESIYPQEEKIAQLALQKALENI